MKISLSSARQRLRARAAAPKCRSCESLLGEPVIDLGSQPLSNAYLTPAELDVPEPRYPLQVRLCAVCALVQADDAMPREVIFHDRYPYYSSFSDSWLEHAKSYAERMCRELALTPSSFIVEIASNDGYLLRWFVERGLRVHGIDPARACAQAAAALGIETTVAFFGEATAREMVVQHGRADLVIANNVLAHVPDLNDFLAGIAATLAPAGLATFEFPHLLRLVADGAFDTIYHEHFSYLSIAALQPLFARHGLDIVDVESLVTHGGSLRVFARRTGTAEAHPRVAAIIAEEAAAGLSDIQTYRRFMQRIEHIRGALGGALDQARAEGKRIAAYGAAAKGNTLLNTFGITSAVMPYVVDRSPYKVGRCMPGSHIPIVALDEVRRQKPDWILILPWNVAGEIIASLSYAAQWGARFYTAIPSFREIA